MILIPSNLFNPALLVIGAIIGLTAADIDLAPPIPLRHRSAWTHGPLIPWLLSIAPGERALWFAIGFLPAYALHLLADMLPRKWRGGALISWFPLGDWRMPALLSLAWIGAGVGLSAWAWWAIVGPMV